MTDPISGAGVSGVLPGMAAAAAAPAKKPDDMDKDTFLKLLVAQLKYQDPTKPVDSGEFMAQTAQFTSLEKLSALADMQTKMLASQQLIGASGLVGRTVSYQGPDGTDVTGVVTSARFSADGPVLRVGDSDVPLTKVQAVNAPKA